MIPTIEIAYVDLPLSPALTLLVQNEIGRLAQRHAGLEHCRVTLARPPAQPGPEPGVSVSLVMDTDLGEVTARREQRGAAGYAYATVRHTFQAAAHELGRRRGAFARATALALVA